MSARSLIARADAGEYLRGWAVAVASPALVEFGGYAGFEWTFIDVHQATIDAETCESMVRAAQNSGMVPIVRLYRNDPATISLYMDMGAGGVLVPHMNTREQAEAIVEQTRFRPVGRRGSNAAARAARYGFVSSVREYQDRVNEESIVIGMIEEKQAVDNLPEILKVPGIDIFMLGLMDMAESLGVAGHWEHPEVQKVVAEVVGQVRSAGRHICIPTMDLDKADEWAQIQRGRGVNFTVVSVYQVLGPATEEFLKATE